MSTDRTATGSVPARIIFPSLRASGPATEQAGYTEGHAAGYAAGVRAAAKEQRRWRDRMAAEQAAAMASGQQDLDRAVRALAVARADFAHRNVQALHDAEEVLARTALELAEAILGYELAHGTRTARAALDRALSGNDDATVLAIRLNPADIEVLAKEGQELPAGLPLRADPSLNRGDAKVEYRQGWLDASLGGALARAREALLGENGRAGNPAGHQP
ncbi:FliH/SctL family protein [Arthrobacter sp. PsM3]|uniref:FliH/SctL family protein n=1 Tax=Arthrobacter sp. PsM3 TaxID=3030531 RepID=UPI00263A500F|nr:FliH/SctL family protein [Arthrobacter sp. PsM3]MDN4642528.1 FliH/SctL family protein [Arthrobacter sp. PsM3]